MPCCSMLPILVRMGLAVSFKDSQNFWQKCCVHCR